MMTMRVWWRRLRSFLGVEEWFINDKITFMLDKVGKVGSKGKAAAKLMMLQRKIKKKKIEYQEGGIKVVASGEGKIKSIEVEGESKDELAETVNKAIEKAQKWSAKKMQGKMGDLGKIFG